MAKGIQMLDQVGGFQISWLNSAQDQQTIDRVNQTMWPDKPGIWDFVFVLVTAEKLVMLRLEAKIRGLDFSFLKD